MTPSVQRQGELEASEIKKSEEAVRKTLKNFTDPFAIIDKDNIASLT
jgi:hypothetical protein